MPYTTECSGDTAVSHTEKNLAIMALTFSLERQTVNE